MVETMGIKTGYKQTEVGVIPEDWGIKSIVENSTMKARIGWQGLTVAEYLKNGDYFLITGTDFVDRKIKWDTCHYVNKVRYVQDKNIQIRVGDILITKDGTIGKVAYVDSLPLNATLNSGVFVIRPKDNAYNPLYLFYIFNSSFFRDFLNKLVAGSTINHLYQKDFVSFQIPLPPTKAEQTAIATALNDADALITQSGKLIAKKRAIKQGAMQELLKPKEGWEVEPIKNIASICTGAKNTQDKINDGTYPFFVRSPTIEKINSYSFDGEAILVAGDGVGTGKVMHYFKGKFDFHQRVYKISDFKNRINGFYFFLYFKNNFLMLAVIYNDPVADNKTDPPQTINFYRQHNKYLYYN
ncbi:MAG: type I restriction enzyme, S subunit [Desulfobacteraceae bacterium Eth-SRB1]|nr:MAG: type I restriction enzyme, S subunit [Desulfobacteraceae bacterium Eth-SRB1]